MIKAIHNNVVLQKRNITNSCGIYMPSNNSDSYIILNVGSDVSTVKTGQIVILNQTPKLYNENNVDYFITSVENIIAIVEDKDE